MGQLRGDPLRLLGKALSAAVGVWIGVALLIVMIVAFVAWPIDRIRVSYAETSASVEWIEVHGKGGTKRFAPSCLGSECVVRGGMGPREGLVLVSLTSPMGPRIVECPFFVVSGSYVVHDQSGTLTCGFRLRRFRFRDGVRSLGWDRDRDGTHENHQAHPQENHHHAGAASRFPRSWIGMRYPDRFFLHTMNDDAPNDLEKRVLDVLLGDDPARQSLQDQARSARVTNRRFTGVGFFTDFMTDPALPDALTAARVLDGVFAIPPEGGIPPVGFLLFIENGCLATLEGYTTDDSWPNVGPDWSVTQIEV